MKLVPSISVVAALAALCGCLGVGEVVKVAEVDGSGDHRIFRIASVGKIMMEPVLWRLEDSGVVDFDRPVTECLLDPLPPEFDSVTLRMLHDNESGLPKELLSALSLGDIFGALNGGMFGTDIYSKFGTRREFIRRLWAPAVRGFVRRRSGKCYSNVGYALMMMAVEDVTGMSTEELCRRYLVEPYGLADTSFDLQDRMRPRLTDACAGHMPWLLSEGAVVPDHRENSVLMYAGGMLSSASDVLKVCYVIMPHLERSKGILRRHRLDCGREILYRSGMVYGGSSFVGFDPVSRRAVVVLKNVTGWPTDEGFELMESLCRAEEAQRR